MIVFPDYEHSLVNLVSSLAKTFGVHTAHSTLPELEVLTAQKNFRNIVLFLFDGLGMDVLEYHLPPSAFLRKHVLCPLSSVFPPTTTAATTSVETGSVPAEHGWLGWTLYFPSIDANVNMFTNTLQDSSVRAADCHVASRDIPTEKLYAKIIANGYGAYSVSHFGTNKIKTAKGMFNEVFRLCSLSGRKYIYAYNEQPDVIMHPTGTYGFFAARAVQSINRSVQRFWRRLKQNPASRDTLVLITADHGHIPIRNTELTCFPDLENMLARRPSFEPRAVNFFVKPDCLKAFPHAFTEHFKTIFPAQLFGGENVPVVAGQRFDTGDAQFILFSRAEVLRMNLFGPGKVHVSLDTSLGDFLAVACADLTLTNSPTSHHFKSHHAGLTVQEMRVPLIALY